MVVNLGKWNNSLQQGYKIVLIEVTYFLHKSWNLKESFHRMEDASSQSIHSKSFNHIRPIDSQTAFQKANLMLVTSKQVTSHFNVYLDKKATSSDVSFLE